MSNNAGVDIEILENNNQKFEILSEDEIYEKIMLEIEEDKKVKSTWAKAFAQMNGDEIKHRFYT